MSKTLPKSRVIEIIKRPHLPALAPELWGGPMIDAIIRDVELSDVPITTGDARVEFIRGILQQFRNFILPQYKTLLDQTDIYVVLQPLFRAEADFETKSIVLFEGLFKLLSFRIELSLLIGEVKRHLDKVPSVSPDEFKSMAFLAQTLSLHFLKHPEPLPNLSNHFDERLNQDAYIAFAGGLLFVLFHELGHLVLNHEMANGIPPSEVAPPLACEEGINIRKGYEFDADAFAFQAIVPEARNTIIVNVWYVMTLHLDYELLLGTAANTHPFSINRVHRLNTLTGALEDPVIGASAMKLFDSRLKLMQERRGAAHPEEHLLAASLRHEINEKAMMAVLAKPDDCRAALDRLVDAYLSIKAT